MTEAVHEHSCHLRTLHCCKSFLMRSCFFSPHLHNCCCIYIDLLNFIFIFIIFPFSIAGLVHATSIVIAFASKPLLFIIDHLADSEVSCIHHGSFSEFLFNFEYFKTAAELKAIGFALSGTHYCFSCLKNAIDHYFKGIERHLAF